MTLLRHCDLRLFAAQNFTFQVPGAEGNFVFIKDAFYKKPNKSILPFPTYFANDDEDTETLEPLVADLGEVDPFMVGE